VTAPPVRVYVDAEQCGRAEARCTESFTVSDIRARSRRLVDLGSDEDTWRALLAEALAYARGEQHA
jgi:hypothetical protein